MELPPPVGPRGKLGRNAPCWCGSGRKYKKCHLNRDQIQADAPGAVFESLAKGFQRKLCSVPESMRHECERGIIRAHTVGKSGSLRHIARKGHVLGIRPSFSSLVRNNGRLVPEPIGLNLASTFTGFCGRHDGQLFSPIDNRQFLGSPEQLFLLAYRAFCREQYTKVASQENIAFMRDADKGKSIRDQVRIQNIVSDFALGTDAGVRDAEVIKSMLDSVLITRNYSGMHSVVVEFSGVFPVQCSGGVFPTHDMANTQLQDLLDLQTTPDILFMNSFASERRGFVTLTHFSNAESAPSRFLDSLTAINSEFLGGIIVQLAFKWLENIFIDPDWWAARSEADRTLLENFMLDSVHPSRPARFDNFRMVSWELPAVETVFRVN